MFLYLWFSYSSQLDNSSNILNHWTFRWFEYAMCCGLKLIHFTVFTIHCIEHNPHTKMYQTSYSVELFDPFWIFFVFFFFFVSERYHFGFCLFGQWFFNNTIIFSSFNCLLTVGIYRKCSEDKKKYTYVWCLEWPFVSIQTMLIWNRKIFTNGINLK